MRRLGLSVCAAISWVVAVGSATAQPPSCPLLTSETPQVLASGLGWAEGPAYLGGGAWVFADIPGDVVLRIDPQGGVGPYIKPSGWANGSLPETDGALVTARHDRTLARLSPDGDVQILASRFEGRRLNSPNDLARGPDGAIYFTDPTFGIEGYGPARAEPEQPVRGVYRIDAAGGLRRVAAGLRQPNGIAFSPDGRTAYVSDTADGSLHAYAVTADGAFDSGRVLARATPGIDGVRVDAAGRIWVAGPNTLAVHEANGDRLCAVSVAAEHVSNLALGGLEGRDVLVTAADRVLLYRASEAVASPR